MTIVFCGGPPGLSGGIEELRERLHTCPDLVMVPSVVLGTQIGCFLGLCKIS